MLPSGGARDTLCGHLWNHKSQRSTALGPQRLDIKHAKQHHFAKHIFCMFTKSPFSWYPLLDAVIYIEIAVNIYENSIKWKEIFRRLLSIAFPLVCNDDASCKERFVNMTKLHHLTNLHHHTLVHEHLIYVSLDKWVNQIGHNWEIACRIRLLLFLACAAKLGIWVISNICMANDNKWRRNIWWRGK